MEVTVRFHGIVGDIAKRKDQRLNLLQDTTVGDLLGSLAAGNPGFASVAKQVRAVVNGSTATKETVLADGDEVVLMRAIGGGR